MALLIMLSVLTLALVPGIRLRLALMAPSSLSLVNTEKPIVEYGSFSFTVGDLAFIISLSAAFLTIAPFAEAMRRRRG
jgi:hypothetical protein